MRLYVKKSQAVFQLCRNAMYYVKQFVKDGQIIKSGMVLGDIYESGFGWYRISADKLNPAVSLIQVAVRRFRAAMAAEARALLLVKTGRATIVAAHVTDAPFVRYTVNPLLVAPPPKPTLADKIGALRAKFGKN